jgi:hypothetical protein
MNFDRDKKLIWITSNDIGEQNIARNLMSRGYDIPDITQLSYKVHFKDITDNFTGFVTLDSPYKKIVSQFKRISNTNWSLKTKTNNEFVEAFRVWFDTFTKYSSLDTGMYIYHQINHRILNKSIIVTPKKPTFIPNLGFFEYENNIFYKDVLTFTQAQFIYHHYQEIFDICGFDPFDFTNRNISIENKVNFIHRY